MRGYVFEGAAAPTAHHAVDLSAILPAQRDRQGALRSIEAPVPDRAAKAVDLAIEAHSFRSATSCTMWFSCFVKMRSARWRVGRILSCRLRRLIFSQIAVAVSTASSSVSRA